MNNSNEILGYMNRLYFAFERDSEKLVCFDLSRFRNEPEKIVQALQEFNESINAEPISTSTQWWSITKKVGNNDYSLTRINDFNDSPTKWYAFARFPDTRKSALMSPHYFERCRRTNGQRSYL